MALGFRLGLFDSGCEDTPELLDPLFCGDDVDTLAMKIALDNHRQRKSGRKMGVFIVEEEDESLGEGQGGP